MIPDRIGTALMLATSAWLIMLISTDPGVHAENAYRLRVGIIAAFILVTAFFPRHLYLSGTVLAFVSLGLVLNVGLFGLFGLGVNGLIPVLLLAIAMWLSRNRLDATDVVLVTALVACGLAIVQPPVVFFAFVVIAAVNALVWLVNMLGSLRVSK